MTTSRLARGRSCVRSIHKANVLLRILAMEATSSSAALGRIPASTGRGHHMTAHIAVLRMRGLAAKVTRLGTRCERPLRCTGWSHLLLGRVNELWQERKVIRTHTCFSTAKVTEAGATAIAMQTGRRSAAATCRRLRYW